jgi:preprotein translocase subunit Sec63
MDELNVTLVLTKKAYQNLCNFEPHHNVLSLNGPDEFSNAIAFPKTVVSTLSNWFNT